MSVDGRGADQVIDRDREPVEFGRLLALSDGIFAFAMTLLVISIAVPAGLDRDGFVSAVANVLPKIGIMALSIAVVASAWVTHHRLFGLVQRADEGLVALNIALLGMVAFVPLPHQVLGDYPHEPLAYALYALVLGAVNAMVVVLDVYVRRRNLLRVTLPEPLFRRELVRGLTVAGGFVLSIPLAFVLVGFTPLLWIALLPLDRLILRYVGGDRQVRGTGEADLSGAQEGNE